MLGGRQNAGVRPGGVAAALILVVGIAQSGFSRVSNAPRVQIENTP
jgi:hypothetical protein